MRIERREITYGEHAGDHAVVVNFDSADVPEPADVRALLRTIFAETDRIVASYEVDDLVMRRLVAAARLPAEPGDRPDPTVYADRGGVLSGRAARACESLVKTNEIQKWPGRNRFPSADGPQDSRGSSHFASWAVAEREEAACSEWLRRKAEHDAEVTSRLVRAAEWIHSVGLDPVVEILDQANETRAAVLSLVQVEALIERLGGPAR